MKRTGLVAVAVTSALMVMSAGGVVPAATPGPAAPAGAAKSGEAPAGPAGPAGAAKTPEAAGSEAGRESAAPDEAANARNAARTRMRECGHQWSAMKKSGAANGLTWKDFSQGCLARK